jgi:hypothetical protein
MHHQQMQIIEIVLFNQEVNDLPDDGVEAGVGTHPAQEMSEARCCRFDVSPGERYEKCVFIGKVLIERSHRNSCLVGNVVRGGTGVALLMENASSCVEDSLHRAPRALLTR